MSAQIQPRPAATGRAHSDVLSGLRALYGIRPADRLLPLLHHVHSAGPSSWRADCPNPVHDHGRQMLAVTEAPDGALLLHCFGCSDTPAILAALGLELADLYPDRQKDDTPEGRREARAAMKRAGWSAALRTITRETDVVRIAASDMAHGRKLSPDDQTRLEVAALRLADARRVLA